MQRRRSILLQLAFLVGTWCVGLSTASAQDLSRQEIRAFKELAREGAELYEAEKFEEAVAKLKEAQAIYDHPDLAYNLGRAHSKLGRCAEARAAFTDFLGRDDISEETEAKARKSLADLESCREPGTVEIACAPAGTRQWLNTPIASTADRPVPWRI